MTGHPVAPAVHHVGSTARIILALLVGGVYAALVTLALLKPLPARYTRPLDHWSPDNPRFLSAHTRVGSVPLARLEDPVSKFGHSLTLVENLRFPLTNLQSIGLKFDVVDTPAGVRPVHAAILSARLRNRGTSLEFKSGAVSGLQTEDILTLDFNSVGEASSSRSTNWDLEVITAAPVSLRLRCQVTSPTEISTLSTNVGVFAAMLGDGKRLAYPQGLFTYVDPEPPVRRLDMVAWAWAWESPERVLHWLGVSFLAILLAIWVLPIGADPLAGVRPGRIALGTASLFFAFGLGQLVLTPPFFGTDEPSHFFSYHRWMGDTKATDAALVEGRRLHSARLLFRPEQKLARYDQDHPWWWFIDNPSTIDTRPAARSATTARLWESTRLLFAARTPLSMLFRLRLMGLVTFCIGAGLAAALLAMAVPRDEWSPWLGWTPLLIPSLPYFAMNYSNYPTLFGGMVLLAAAMASILVTPARSWWIGGTIGLTTGFVLHTSQSAFPATAFVLIGLGVIASGRLFRPEAVESPRSPNFGFWILLGAGLMAASLLTTPEFETESQLRLGQARARLPGFELLSYSGGVAVVCAGGCLLETVCIWLRGRWSMAVGHWLSGWCSVLAIMVGVGLVRNSMGPTPHLEPLQEVVPSWEFAPNQRNLLPPVDQQYPTEIAPRVKQYDLAAAKAVFGSFGVGGHDFMTSRLFWVVGGYIDCEAPQIWISIFSFLFAFGLAQLFANLGIHRDGERTWILLGLLCGLVVYLVLMATGSITAFSKPSLHGRYLTGFYLCLLTLCFVGFRRLLAAKTASHPLLMASLAFGIPLAHQLSLISAQLERYY